MPHLRIGTRTSRLALWQTNHVLEQLTTVWPDLTSEFRHMVTQGDRTLDRPLPEIGGKGLFTSELEEALRNDVIDIAVHSLKDLPVEAADGLVVGAILRRADVRDVMVAAPGVTLLGLAAGAIVGTSSLRRRAQLMSVRPDIVVKPIRGNVDTRVRKVVQGEYAAAVMAAAGLARLGLEEHISEWLGEEVMLPAPAQGAIAVQCRAGDCETLRLLTAIDHPETRSAVTAERRLLSLLGGGCSAPVAALARHGSSGALRLTARVLSVDGQDVAEVTVTDSTADGAAEAAALSLFSQKAGAILAERDGTHRTLLGKRVVITRPESQTVEFAAALALEGATPLPINAIRTVPLPDLQPARETLARIDRFDWILFTSANAARHFFDLVQGEQGTWAARLGAVRVAAVGSVTASALKNRGIHVHVTPDEFTANALSTAIPDLDGSRVLLPRSALGSADLPRRLAEAGADVVDLPIYTTEAVIPSPDALAELAAGVDAVTFTSGSSVRGLLQAVQHFPQAQSALTDACIACIGPSTAAAARDAGLTVAVVAREHTIPGLISALADYFSKRT